VIHLSSADQVAGALKFMRETGGLSQRKLRLADALGYDLALIPREEA
jgi:hypothetical protein